jgi:ABC-type transport system substrate-binding protein
MINHFPTYKGQPNPLADLRVRQCLAYGIDYEEVRQKRFAGITKLANGPFGPGTDGYVEDTGYPKYDPVKAKSLCDAYKAEKGITGDLEIQFGTTADPFNKGTDELIAAQWKKIGVNAPIDQTEQGAYITRGLTGDFQVLGWRNFGGFSQDRNFIWWQSAFALDPPNLALNFGRYKSKVVDDALIVLRTTTDQNARKTAAQTINKQLAADVANLWLGWTLWAFMADKSVQDIGGGTLPDGTPAAPSNALAQHWTGHIWLKK